MTIENFAEGLSLMVKHGASGYSVAAEHDIVYATNARELKLTLTEYRKLRKLGWLVDKEVESWYAYV